MWHRTLQVVELPREKPEAPLRLFADVPGLRLLAIGGDGTVAWLLGCLEDLRTEREAAGLPWHAPPVGVLPLGTGVPLTQLVCPSLTTRPTCAYCLQYFGTYTWAVQVGSAWAKALRCPPWPQLRRRLLSFWAFSKR